MIYFSIKQTPSLHLNSLLFISSLHPHSIVFLDGANNVKLGDFGLSRVIDDPEVEFARTYVG